MKLTKKIAAALCLALIACLAAQVALPVSLGVVTTAQAASAKLSKTKATILSAEQLQLKLHGAGGATVKWSSSNRKVAKVDANGLVTGVKAGSATITAKLGTKKYTCEVKVKAPLKANKTSITMIKGETTKVKLTWEYMGGISVKWDNASVVNCKMSGVWDGKVTTMTVNAVGVGSSTITFTNTVTKDVLKIKVTVKKSDQLELDSLMGSTVKAANKLMDDKLEGAQIGYANDFVGVRLNSLNRINRISVYGGKGKYRLFNTYAGLKVTTAVSRLKAQGWTLNKKTDEGDIYLCESDPSHAILLEKASTKVACVTYYTP